MGCRGGWRCGGGWWAIVCTMLLKIIQHLTWPVFCQCASAMRCDHHRWAIGWGISGPGFEVLWLAVGVIFGRAGDAMKRSAQLKANGQNVGVNFSRWLFWENLFRKPTSRAWRIPCWSSVQPGHNLHLAACFHRILFFFLFLVGWLDGFLRACESLKVAQTNLFVAVFWFSLENGESKQQKKYQRWSKWDLFDTICECKTQRYGWN